MSDLYVLDEQGEPRREHDTITWAEWFARDERRVVRRNTFEIGGREITVSTVFLGLNHHWREDGPPVLWETMVFGLDDDDDDVQMRYTSRDAAIAEHERLVALWSP